MEIRQFDELLGGKQSLPPFIHIKGMVNARMEEISALTEAIEDPQRKGVAFQHLPKHMRRRAMGHSSKRMPRNLRAKHHESLEGNKLKEEKKSSRKYRRRPKLLLEEYNRRQRNFIWLETHVWHAKRFHMTDKWGYRLPDYPNDKCFRACYRATSNYCLLMDISYYNCIELRGSPVDILSGLAHHMHSECGLGYGAKLTYDGTREGRVIFFKKDMFPMGAIGEISFLWNPNISETRRLWLWVHPSYYLEVLKEMFETFDLVVEPMEMREPPKKKLKKDILKLVEKNVPFVRTPKYFSKKFNIQLIELKDTLSRFRLIGPRSQSVISKSLRPVSLDNKFTPSWFLEYLNESKSHEESVVIQKQVWDEFEKMTSPAQYPPSCVLSMITVDPRLTMPSKRDTVIEIIKDSPENPLNQVSPIKSAMNPIWNDFIRDKVTEEKTDWSKLSEIRQEKIVPGLEYESLDEDSVPYVPVMIIQQPGNQNNFKKLGYGSGWDVIIPAGWGVPFWMGFIYRGGRAGGLREIDSLRRECGQLPFLCPDTSAGLFEDKKVEETLMESYFRVPPSKRRNHLNLGISSPFRCPWEVLAQDWSPNKSSSYIVFRDKHKLNLIQEAIYGKHFEKLDLFIKDLDRCLNKEKNPLILIPVNLILKGKGKVNDYSILSIPKIEDLEELSRNKEYIGPLEPPHKDINKEIRKQLRDQHLNNLKRIKRKRKKGNYNYASEGTTDLELIINQKNKISNLWLPECKTVKDACERTTIGFITDGGFTFTESMPSGVGYICLPGFINLIKVLLQSNISKPLVLLRSFSRQYRFANINVVT